MFSKFRVLIIVVLLIAANASVRAQVWEVGGWVGTAAYFGDLNTNFSVRRPGPAIGLTGRMNLDQRIALRASINYANVSFDDKLSSNPFQKARNLSFRNNIIEGSFLMEFNFMPYLHGDKEKFYAPYIIGGVTLFKHNPQAKYERTWYNLAELGTEGQMRGQEYFLVQPALSYGLGLKIDIATNWSLNFEFTSRYLFTDYLDDVSQNYADLTDIAGQRGDIAAALADRSGEVNPEGINTGRAGYQRGDRLTRDTYATFGIGLIYNFSQIQCPDFWKPY